MSSKKETTKPTTKKPAAKRVTAAQKLKLSEAKVKDLESTVEKLKKEVHSVEETSIEFSKALHEEHLAKNQFEQDVERLIQTWENSSFFVKVTRSFKMIKSLVALFKYYINANKNEVND